MIDEFAKALKSIDDDSWVEVRPDAPFKDIVIDGSYNLEAIEAWLEAHVKEARVAERKHIINVIRKMRIDNYREDPSLGYHTGWDIGLHDVIDVLEDEDV